MVLTPKKLFTTITALLSIITLSAGCDRTKTVLSSVSPISPTAIALTSTVELSLTPTITLLPTSIPPQYEVDCLPILPELPVNADLEGTVALFTKNPTQGMLLVLKTSAEISLPLNAGENIGYIKSSANRKMLAVVLYKKYHELARLLILDAQGNPLTEEKNYDGLKWQALLKWVDDEHLFFEGTNVVGARLDSVALPLIIYDPFTGETQEIDPTIYPNIELYENNVFWSDAKRTVTAYSPALDQVAFLTKGKGIVLWDRNLNKKIIEIWGTNYYGNGPIWSPNGNATNISIYCL